MMNLILILSVLLVTLAVGISATAEAVRDLFQKARWCRQYGEYPDGSAWTTLVVLFWASLALGSMALIIKLAFVAAMC